MLTYTIAQCVQSTFDNCIVCAFFGSSIFFCVKRSHLSCVDRFDSLRDVGTLEYVLALFEISHYLLNQ